MQEAIPSPALPQSALLCHTLSPTKLAQRPNWKPLPIVTSCSALTYPDTAVCLLIDILFITKAWNRHFFSFPKARQALHSSILTTLCEGWFMGPATCEGRVPNSRRFTNLQMQNKSQCTPHNHSQSNCSLPEHTTQLGKHQMKEQHSEHCMSPFLNWAEFPL